MLQYTKKSHDTACFLTYFHTLLGFHIENIQTMCNCKIETNKKGSSMLELPFFICFDFLITLQQLIEQPVQIRKNDFLFSCGIQLLRQ